MLPLHNPNNSRRSRRIIYQALPRWLRGYCERISNNDPKITTLNLYRQHIGENGAIAIGKALGYQCLSNDNNNNSNNDDDNKNNDNNNKSIHIYKNTTVEKVFMGWNNIGDNGLKLFVEEAKLDENEHIKLLALEDNNIGASGANAIQKLLLNDRKCKLRELHIMRNNLGPHGTLAITKGLRHNNSLLELNLSSNEIGDEGAWCVGQMLEVNITLQTLYLMDNKIGFEGITSLVNSMCKNKTVAVLNLRSNYIGDEGSIPIKKLLLKNKTLKKLDLSYNKIENSGVLAIADGLTNNHSLDELYLYEIDNIKIEGVIALRESLSIKNKTLERLALHFSYIPGLETEQQKIDFYCTLNKNGRRIVEEGGGPYFAPIPLPLWPILLDRVQQNEIYNTHNDCDESHSPSIIYWFLKENPCLFQQLSRRRHQKQPNMQQKQRQKLNATRSTDEKRRLITKNAMNNYPKFSCPIFCGRKRQYNEMSNG